MEQTLHIQAYGDVENAQFSGAAEFGIISLSTIIDQINAAPNATEIVVHIHSRGGDAAEGFAIHDYLVGTGKKITTIIEGMCASIATVIALAGSVRRMNNNATVIIHNPWTVASGDADELQRMAEFTRLYEDKLINFYAEKTGVDADQIKSMMAVETAMSSSQALELRFATEIVAEPKVKVYARITPQSSDKFKTENKMSESKNLIDKITALFKQNGIKASIVPETVKDLDLKLKDGEKPLHVQTEAAEPAIGDTVSYDGSATPEKEYELEDGRKIKTDAESKISDIVAAPTQAAAPGTPTQDEKDQTIAALNAQLKTANDAAAANATKISVLEATIAQNKTDIATINSMVDVLASNIKSGFRPENENTRFNSGPRDENAPTTNDSVQDAIEKERQRGQARFKNRPGRTAEKV